ncbi:MAG: FemAB family PEP-CTERM system-associated protein [Alphaproteobacteria bacterium]|nr:MAG: FemAB family PEP-CTERM system-associated protein [Alphaproteobacteria bacterium]
MSVELSLLEFSPEADAEWDAFVRETEGGSFFHLSGWRHVVARAFGHKSYYVEAREAGRLVGILPLTHIQSRLFGNALISNGFCMGGGPLGLTSDVYDILEAEARELMRHTGAAYVEYRAPHRRNENLPAREDLYANFSRPLPEDEDEALKLIPRKQRAVVRKALKNEALTVRMDEKVDDFHHLYAVSVRNLGTPVFGKTYFQALVDIFGADCDILTICHEGKPVSAVLSFYFNDTVMPYYTGSLPAARGLGSNDLMYWQLMRRAITKGKTYFDFGRSKVGTGPYAFKKNWGFDPKPIAHEFILAEGQEMPNLSPANPKYHLAVKLWSHLPLPVANFLGPKIVRNIG